jgi:hypothetical protein
MHNEVWVLGASGPTGRLIAKRLDEAGVPLVLSGRDRGRLEGVAAELGGNPRLVVGSLAATLATLEQDPPGVQVFVTAAGFGVLATESVLLRLCAGRPPASRVRVDAMAAIALDAGVVGPALAATIVEVVSFGGREVRDGRLVPARSAAHPVQLTSPDGDVLRTGSGASGELLAAWRASNADSVVAASTAAPSNPVVRAMLPALSALFRVPGVSRFAVGRIARIRLRAQEMPRASSWAHARAEWADGTVREGWLRVTASVAAEVTMRLFAGVGQPGAHTPGGLFAPELAEAAGGEFLLDQPVP